MGNFKVGMVLSVVVSLLLLLMWSSDNDEDKTDTEDQKELTSSHPRPVLLPTSLREQHPETLQQDTKTAFDDVLLLWQIFPAMIPRSATHTDQQTSVANNVLSGKLCTGEKANQDRATDEMFQLKFLSVITTPIREREVGSGDVSGDQQTRSRRISREDPSVKTSVSRNNPTGEVATTASTIHDSLPHSQLEDILNNQMNNPGPSAVNLCDHPPNTFSPTFIGQSPETCKVRGIQITQNNVQTICGVALKTVKSEKIGYKFSHRGEIYAVYTGKFGTFCGPFYAKFFKYKCIENAFLTVCSNPNIIFINQETCPLVDSKFALQVLLVNYLTESTECIPSICTIGTEITENTEYEISLFFVRNPFRCPNLPITLSQSNGIPVNSLYFTRNVQWPSCYQDQIVIWSDDPKKYGLHWSSSYLPPNCLSVEVFFVVMVGCVAVSGVVGNLLVIVVMRTGKHGRGQSSRLRTSLAVADLINVIFVVYPSLYYHIHNFFSIPEYQTSSLETLKIIPRSFFAKNGGFFFFQAMLHNVASIVSIQTVFLLSIERLILTTRPLKYNHYITAPIITGLISLTWMVAVLQCLLFVHSGGEYLTEIIWDESSKLPVGVSFLDRAMWSEILFLIYYALIVIILLITIFCSVLAIISFMRGQAQLKEEWKALKMKYAGPMKRENRHIIITQLLIIFFFLLSVTPFGCFVLINVNEIKLKNLDVLYYIARWCFLASTAWNPWIYNFRSKPFKEDMTLTWQKVSQLAKRLYNRS